MPQPPPLDDPDYVRDEYADDTRLSGRVALWAANPGPQPQDRAFELIQQLEPTTILEVGCGQGAFAAALTAHGYDVTAVDQSARMVEVTAARGVTAQRADVQDLPFDDGSVDLVAANYMLYHVADRPRAFAEIARVLRPGGALVAVTNSERQLNELWDLVGRPRAESRSAFSRENGAGQLAPYFATVTGHDVERTFQVTASAIRSYVSATRFAELAGNLPELPDGLTVTAAGTVFVATTHA